jgi:hypothetical protein
VRQAAPVDSKYVTAITHSHWKCKLCAADIFAAVISAGVIKHYKRAHRSELPMVQLELCQVGDILINLKIKNGLFIYYFELPIFY